MAEKKTKQHSEQNLSEVNSLKGLDKLFGVQLKVENNGFLTLVIYLFPSWKGGNGLG